MKWLVSLFAASLLVGGDVALDPVTGLERQAAQWYGRYLASEDGVRRSGPIRADATGRVVVRLQHLETGAQQYLVTYWTRGLTGRWTLAKRTWQHGPEPYTTHCINQGEEANCTCQGPCTPEQPEDKSCRSYCRRDMCDCTKPHCHT